VIVTVGNTKGGRDVLLVDGDRQESSQTAVAVHAEADRKPGITCVHYPDGGLLRAQMQRQAGKYDDVLIDAGVRDNAALRAALVLSDVPLVPFPPRLVDVWALGDIAALVDEACSVRDGLRAHAVLNAADPGVSSDNTDAAAALADFPRLTLLDAPIRRRKAFANAVGLGLSVDELNPRDPKACEELAALNRIVFANGVDMELA
jgi:chromosome partitioning protein